MFKRSFQFCSLLYLLMSLSGESVHGQSNSGPSEMSSAQLRELVEKNTQRADQLIAQLYSEKEMVTYNESIDTHESFNEGTQVGYLDKGGIAHTYGTLVDFKRVWSYDAGVALMLAVERNDPSSDARARWLLKHGVYTTNPEKPDSTIFAGWPFSKNQKRFGDNWTDCRFMTGANAYVVLSLGKYINSSFFRKLDKELQKEFQNLYLDALQGLLYHIESEEPNSSLATAGWTLNVLNEFSQTSYSYNKILDIMGYGPKPIESYSKPIRRIKARNVVTEHCNNVLAVLNYTLNHYNSFPKLSTVYEYEELNNIRINLRENLFTKLFNETERRFITGRTAEGVPSIYSAVDNTSWMVLSLKLEELNLDQVIALTDSLVFTVETFVKKFELNDKTYLGSCYFEDGFEDAYIEKSSLHSESYHVEATCGLICALLKFVKTYPDHADTRLFHVTALNLWKDLQRLLNDFGFIYASSSLKNVSESLESSISALWYLRTKNYIDSNPEFTTLPYHKK